MYSLLYGAALLLLVGLSFAVITAERGRRQTAQALRQSNIEMEALFDLIPAMIWFKDTENRHIRVNQRVADAAGRPVDDFAGRPCADIYPDHADAYYADDLEVIRSRQPKVGIVERLAVAGGEIRWVQTDKVPYFDSSGKVIGILVVAQDITARKQVDDALREERNRLAILATTAPSVLHSFRQAADGAMSFPYASPRIEEIYGLHPENLANNAGAVAELWHPNDVERLLQTIANSKQTLQPWREEFRVLHPTRGEIWVEGHSMPVPDADGSVTWHGALTDITERRRVQDELRKREQLLEETGELAHIGGWEFDPRTGRGQCTREVARIYDLDPGASPSAEMGLQRFPDDSRRRLEAALARAVRDHHSYDLELEFVSDAGTHKWLRTIGRPVVENGVVVLVRGAIQDISERKRAERAIQERLALEERLSMLTTLSPAVMYTYRLATDGSTSFPFASARLEETFGIHPSALTESAEPALKLIHADDAARFRHSVAHSAQTLTLWNEEFRYHHPSKGMLWFEARALPKSQPDGSTLWYGFLLEITRRKELEDQLRQSQKMEAIGQLAGGVAHDFNNLLTVIHGNAALLAEAVPPALSEQVLEIVTAAERAAGMTRQLLLFSRKQVMQPIDLDLNGVLSATTRLLQRILGEDIALESQFTPVPAMVHADPSMMEQVLLNLAINARDAMPGGGRLQIITSCDEANEDSPVGVTGPYVCLTVADTGCGIAPAVLPRIFEPFFTTKELGKGTGLGLATIYGIVKQHTGTITVESEVGRGTTFRIFIPTIDRPVSEATVVTYKSPMPQGTECILVVEDEPSVRQLTQRVLQRCGYTVLTAATGRAALDIWPAIGSTVDLVLTDMVMPDGVEGSTLVRELQKDRPDIKYIFASGYSPEMAGAGILLRQGINFIQKPYLLEDLALTVRHRLDELPVAGGRA